VDLTHQDETAPLKKETFIQKSYSEINLVWVQKTREERCGLKETYFHSEEYLLLQNHRCENLKSYIFSFPFRSLSEMKQCMAEP
jgi:hypothetical protein